MKEFMKKFSSWLNENKFYNKFNLTEASSKDLMSGTNEWNNVSIEDMNSGNFPDTVKIAAKYAFNKLGCVIGFKYPSTNVTSATQPLYIKVDPSHKSRSSRKELYKQMISFSTPTKIESDVYVYTAIKSELPTDGSVDLTSKGFMQANNINAEKLGNSRCFIGIYQKTGDVLNLTGVVRFKIEADESENTEGGSIKCQIKSANSLLKRIFGGNGATLDRKSAADFGDKIVSTLKSMNINETECKVYDLIFNQSYKGENDYNPKVLKKLMINKTTSVLDYMNNSNISVTVAELIIPWLLALGVKTICGINVNEILTGDANAFCTHISWPDGATNGNTDYEICYANYNNHKPVGISAKAEGGHKTTLISLIWDNLDNKLFKKSSTISNIANGLKILKKINPAATSALKTWVAGASVKKSLSSADVSQLSFTYNELVTSDKYYNKKNLPKPVLTLLKELDVLSADKWFPYSLTSNFEKIAAEGINSDAKNSYDIIYRIKMAEPYFQIEMLKDNQNGFKLVVIEPEQVNSTKNMQNKIKKIVAVATNGAKSDPDKEENPLVKAKKLTTLAGNGQFLGIKLSDK